MCHTPQLKTDIVTSKALSQQTVNLYSDLALHQMGPGLADGISQGDARGEEFRTAPLWGVGERLFLLLDGRSRDLTDAIRQHDGPGSEARNVVRNYEFLAIPITNLEGDSILFDGAAFPFCSLENKLQAKLNNPRAAGTCDHTERRLVQRPSRNSKVRVIHHVEKFSTQLAVQPFCYGRVFENRKVPILAARPNQGILSSVPQSELWRQGISCPVEIIGSCIHSALLN